MRRGSARAARALAEEVGEGERRRGARLPRGEERGRGLCACNRTSKGRGGMLFSSLSSLRFGGGGARFSCFPKNRELFSHCANPSLSMACGPCWAA